MGGEGKKKEKKEPEIEGGININIGGLNLGDLLGNILGDLDIDELLKTGGGEETREFEIGGRKGVISRGIRIGGLGGGLSKEPSEEFKVRHYKPRARGTEKPVPVVEEKAQAPALDVFEEGDYIKVIGDMPGVNEEDIHYKLKEKTLRIYTEGDRRYGKEIELPALVTEEIDLKYRNGVLEIALTKKK